ncbi:MAG: hypothetical protein ACJA2M_002703 [Polaribacter sp.]|jgi:hypothetical protein
MKNNKTKWLQDNSGFTFCNGKTNAFTIKQHSLSKIDVDFSDEQLKSFSKSTIDYLAAMDGFQDRVSAKNTVDNAAIFDLDNFEDANPEFIYKYISESSLKYFQKGSFQVGSTGYFQKMENEKARDELEGLSFISTRTNERIINSTIEMGFNHYIFCATNQENNLISKYHKENFGPVLLKIRAKPFIEKIAKRLGATSYKIQNVIYSNAKLLKTNLDVNTTPENFSNLSSKESLEYGRHLIESVTTPSLFIKSGWFNPENELRIVFTMPYNVSQVSPKRFEHLGLLKYIEIIK